VPGGWESSGSSGWGHAPLHILALLPEHLERVEDHRAHERGERGARLRDGAEGVRFGKKLWDIRAHCLPAQLPRAGGRSASVPLGRRERNKLALAVTCGVR
jgi:hypothetical protein